MGAGAALVPVHVPVAVRIGTVAERRVGDPGLPPKAVLEGADEKGWEVIRGLESEDLGDPWASLEGAYRFVRFAWCEGE